LDRTKQAISLHKKKILELLKATLLADNYAGCRFRFRAEFTLPLRRLTQAMVQQDKPLRYSKWTNVLNKIWMLGPNDLGGSESVILELLGYQVRYRVGRKHEPIVGAAPHSTSNLSATLRMTERLLRNDFPAGLSMKELTEKLYSRGQPKVSASELRRFVRAIPGIEQKEGKLRLRLEKLFRATDQLERILQERGHPMKGTELAQELAKLWQKMGSKRNPIHLRHAMNWDRRKRFKPVGRSGLWSLSAWAFETGNVADVAARFLRESKRPMTEAELYPLILARRPVKLDSIGSLLRESGRFRRIRPRTWQLKGTPGPK